MVPPKSIVLAFVLLLSEVVVPILGQSWRNTIPTGETVVEDARSAFLAYEIDSVNSTAVQLSKTPLKLRWYRETDAGVEAMILVGTQTKILHVVFRGTDGELVDTFVDFAFKLVNFSMPGLTGGKFGRVHKGFQVALQGIVPSLDVALKSAMKAYPTYEVRVGGHSLGAALAHLYGFYAAKTFLRNDNLRVVNVGQPRVGDTNFAYNVEATKNLAVFRLVFEDGKWASCSQVCLSVDEGEFSLSVFLSYCSPQGTVLQTLWPEFL